MKKLFLFLSFTVCLCIVSKSQSKEVREAEANFLSYIGIRLLPKLNVTTLSDVPFKKLFYFSYQVVNKDSVNWISYNYRNHLIDSIVQTAFMGAVDSARKKGILLLLKNEERTYLPIYVFYKTPDKDMHDDSVPISPTESLFGWEINEKNEIQTVFRVTKPFIFQLPKSKPYYEKPEPKVSN